MVGLGTFDDRWEHTKQNTKKNTSVEPPQIAAVLFPKAVFYAAVPECWNQHDGARREGKKNRLKFAANLTLALNCVKLLEEVEFLRACWTATPVFLFPSKAFETKCA